MILWLWIHWESLKSPPWPFLTHTWLCPWRTLSSHPALRSDCLNPKSTRHSQCYQLLIGKTSVFSAVPRQKLRVMLVWNQKMCPKGSNVFSESTSWLNLSAKGARVGICGQVHPSGLTSFSKVEWVFSLAALGNLSKTLGSKIKYQRWAFLGWASAWRESNCFYVSTCPSCWSPFELAGRGLVHC